VLKKLIPVVATLLLVGCATNQQLSATSKVALQEVAAIAVRRAVGDSPRFAEKAQNIRYIASRLQSATSVTSIADLRKAVDVELDGLKLTAVDRADANSLLNIFQALLQEQIGDGAIDSAALVQVNEFIGYIVAALPPA
jgi:hypothetical protein